MHLLQPIHRAHRHEHVGGVGPLPAPGSKQPGGHGTLQDRVQQALFK